MVFAVRKEPPHILIVEDDEAARGLLRRYLTSRGAIVTEAENPFIALGRLSNGRFDVVLSDVNMAPRSGLWLAEEVRQNWPEVPLLFMTGGSVDDKVIETLLGRTHVLLRKPFAFEEVDKHLRDVLKQWPAAKVTETQAIAPEPATAGYVSGSIQKLLAGAVGLDSSAVIPWIGLIHPEDTDRVRAEAEIALASGKAFTAEYRLKLGDRTVWVVHEAKPVESDGRPRLQTGALIDVTERKQDEVNLRVSEERHRFLAEHAADLITVQSPDAWFLYASPACRGLLGYEPSELYGRSMYDLVHREDMPAVRQSFEDVLNRPVMVTVPYRIRRRDNRYVWFETTARMVYRSDPSVPREIICVSRDITERKRQEDELRGLTILDELTGLYNRRGFLTIASQQLRGARRKKRGAVVLFADVNGLRHINETLGQPDGDQAIIDAANVLIRTFRDSDVIARVGGDEFAVLAVETGAQNLERMRSRLEAALEATNRASTRPFQLSISIGSATYDPSANPTIEQLLLWADQSMYEQKKLARVF